jgi:hypothetical protein
MDPVKTLAKRAMPIHFGEGQHTRIRDHTWERLEGLTAPIALLGRGAGVEEARKATSHFPNKSCALIYARRHQAAPIRGERTCR